MHRFRIDALADPQSLARVAGFFAQRAIIPAGLSAERDQGWMRIEVAGAGLAPQQAAVIAVNLGDAVAVVAVGWEGTGCRYRTCFGGAQACGNRRGTAKGSGG